MVLKKMTIEHAADADMTQREVAALIPCDQSLYSKYERGVRELPLGYAVKLAAFYKVSVDYLIGLSDEKRR
nr:helix-turn-helix transcriptional regulator [Maliibacterium massiliense]